MTQVQTIPASTITLIASPVYITQTLSGSPVYITQSAPTSFVTISGSVQTLPASTVTQTMTGSVIYITQTLPVSTVYSTVTDQPGICQNSGTVYITKEATFARSTVYETPGVSTVYITEVETIEPREITLEPSTITELATETYFSTITPAPQIVTEEPDTSTIYFTVEGPTTYISQECSNMPIYATV